MPWRQALQAARQARTFKMPVQQLQRQAQRQAARLMPNTVGQAMGIGVATFGMTTYGLFRFRDQMLDDYDSGEFTDREVLNRAIARGPRFVRQNMFPATPAAFVRETGRVGMNTLISSCNNHLTLKEEVQQYLTRKRRVE